LDVTGLTKENSNECLIKGNVNRENKKIYHVPQGKYYEQTKAEKWFCTEQQAMKAGFKKSGE
jgi:micrococcal nuclease